MIKHLACILLLLSMSGLLFAQQNFRPFVLDAPYYDDGIASFEGSDKRTILFGNTSSYNFTAAKPWMIVLDSNDQLESRITFTNFAQNNEHIESVIKTSYGMYIMTGYVQVNTQYKIFVSAVNPAGQILWAKSYGGSDWTFAKDVVQIENNDFVICGETYSQTAGGSDAFLLRINAQGDSLKYTSFGGQDDDIAHALLFNLKKEVVVTGSSKSYGLGSKDAFLYRCTQDLDSLHFSTGLSSYDTEAYDIIQYPDSHYIVAGYRQDSLGDSFVWSEKMDGTGNYLWNTSTKSSLDGRYYDLEYSPWDGNIHLLGKTNEHGLGGYDVLLHKFNSGGWYQQSTTLGKEEGDIGLDLRIDDQKRFHLTGSTRSFDAILTALYYIRLDSTYQTNLSDLNYISVGLQQADNKELQASVYPNPAHNTLTIELGSGSGNAFQMKIMDVNGKTLLQKEGTGESQIQVDVSKLSKGMYLLQLSSGSATRVQKLLIH